MDNQELAMKGSARYDDIRREAFDVIPRTLFTSSVVCLSLIVPLYFQKVQDCCCARWSFRVSAVLMVLSLICSAFVFKRSFRLANAGMKVYEELSIGQRSKGSNDARFLTIGERVAFVVSIITFAGSIISLMVSMFV